jgi:hypothetical protein
MSLHDSKACMRTFDSSMHAYMQCNRPERRCSFRDVFAAVGRPDGRPQDIELSPDHAALIRFERQKAQ